jgi:hypothetical protein
MSLQGGKSLVPCCDASQATIELRLLDCMQSMSDYPVALESLSSRNIFIPQSVERIFAITLIALQLENGARAMLKFAVCAHRRSGRRADMTAF